MTAILALSLGVAQAAPATSIPATIPLRISSSGYLVEVVWGASRSGLSWTPGRIERS